MKAWALIINLSSAAHSRGAVLIRFRSFPILAAGILKSRRLAGPQSMYALAD